MLIGKGGARAVEWGQKNLNSLNYMFILCFLSLILSSYNLISFLFFFFSLDFFDVILSFFFLFFFFFFFDCDVFLLNHS
jgi:ABC-type transport system involved in Fe-S cluster assembly fused permease/ATPase subunit